MSNSLLSDFCEKGADVMFSVDTSVSIGEANFHKQNQFISEFVKSFDIGDADDKFHFGLMFWTNQTYSPAISMRASTLKKVVLNILKRSLVTEPRKS